MIKDNELLTNNWGEYIHKSVFDDMIDQANTDNNTQDGKINTNRTNIDINRQNITTNANNIVKNASAIEALKQDNLQQAQQITDLKTKLATANTNISDLQTALEALTQRVKVLENSNAEKQPHA